MRMAMGSKWEVAACGHRSTAVSRRGNKEDNDEMARMTNRAMEMP
jgi:hypothetical protein